MRELIEEIQQTLDKELPPEEDVRANYRLMGELRHRLTNALQALRDAEAVDAGRELMEAEARDVARSMTRRDGYELVAGMVQDELNDPEIMLQSEICDLETLHMGEGGYATILDVTVARHKYHVVVLEALGGHD